MGRDLTLLWTGQGVSQLGDAVTLLALPLTAVVVLHASTFEVGALEWSLGLRGAMRSLTAGIAVLPVLQAFLASAPLRRGGAGGRRVGQGTSSRDVRGSTCTTAGWDGWGTRARC